MLGGVKLHTHTHTHTHTYIYIHTDKHIFLIEWQWSPGVWCFLYIKNCCKCVIWFNALENLKIMRWLSGNCKQSLKFSVCLLQIRIECWGSNQGQRRVAYQYWIADIFGVKRSIRKVPDLCSKQKKAHTWSAGNLISLKVVSLGLRILLPAMPPLLEIFRKKSLSEGCLARLSLQS